MWRLRELKRSILSLWYWFPIIWKDRNWDQHYIYEVLKHKLKAQSKYIGRRYLHTRAQQDARNMRWCVALIQKEQDEFYAMECMDYEKIDMLFTPCEDKEGYSELSMKVEEYDYQPYFEKYPLIFKRVLNGEGMFKIEEEMKEYDKQHRMAMSIAHINQDRCRKLLFKIMYQEVNGWWD